MRFLFDDESFSFEALRAAGYATYGGAELGEVLVACRDIADGDEQAWSTRWARLAGASQQAFAQAADLLDIPASKVRIPYQGTTLPGYFFFADTTGEPRPTVIYHGGYDSTLEEDYLALAAGALRRGYHVLAFDGPGQGSTVRDQGLHFRPDWEAVVTPVVDYALALPHVDPDRIALVGTSLGG
jgi:dipeptidyl aminopeptidase/acylaminoacyl peptidase